METTCACHISLNHDNDRKCFEETSQSVGAGLYVMFHACLFNLMETIKDYIQFNGAGLDVMLHVSIW